MNPGPVEVGISPSRPESTGLCYSPGSAGAKGFRDIVELAIVFDGVYPPLYFTYEHPFL